MSLRPTANRFRQGGLVPPETMTPEVLAIFDLPPVNKEEAERRACIAVITAQIPKALEDMQAEALAQAIGFSSSFRRFGDFLMIELERKANSTREQKYAATLNLNKVSHISITRGRDVTNEGYTFGLDRYNISRMKSGETVAEYYARTPPIKTPKWRPFIQTTEMSVLYGNAVWGSRHSFDPQQDSFFHVEDIPQPSVDDLLVFHGSESFHLPFGRGDSVLFQVMHAIEKGWEKPSLSSLTLKDALA